MKLLIFISSLSSGGAERVSVTLANYWASRGWDVTVVTLATPDQDFYHLYPTVTRIAFNMAGESGGLLMGLYNNVRRVIKLRRALTQLNPDVAISMMSTANILMGIASIGLRSLKKFGSERIHPPEMPLGRLWELMRIFWYGRLDAIVAQSYESAKWIRTNTTAKRVAVIPNPVIWPLPINEPVLSPESVGNPLRKRILAVGRMEPQKGFDLLLDAFATMVPTHGDWELVILGEGTLRATLQDKVDALKLGERIILPGRVGNVGEWYSHAALYVMSSRFEGFPNTLVEAMAYGLPAVSFDCETGPRDIINQDVDGLLVPQGDTGALANAVERLLCDSNLRERMAESALQVRKRFSLERVAAMWEQLFCGICNERK